VRRAIAAVLSMVLGSGCFNHVVIPASELKQLDGFGTVANHSFQLHGTEGEVVTFDHKTALTLTTDAPLGTFLFQQIAFKDGRFDSLVVGGRPFALDAATITRVETEVLNGDRTVLAVLGLVVAVAAIGAGSAGLLFLTRIQH
jgi:hypothetical protein